MITVEHLSKRYGHHLAVSDVTFRCEPGTITGFLGPNGAGKSTSLRMITGLTPPTSGRALVDGRPFADLPNPGREVGVLLDAAAVHPGRTGRETLRLTARLLGLPVKRADEILEVVGLAGAAGRRVGGYSLGMRQRLGIGGALLGDPAVLIMDEPANGMDPEGIRWMRKLLQDFAGRGGTVLLSSHLLAEVQATVDRLVVIGGGRIVADGVMADLLRGSGSVVRGLDTPALVTALRIAGLSATPTPDGRLTVDGSPEQVGRAAAAAGQALLELREQSSGLEDLFFSLTEGSSVHAAAGRAA